MISRLFSYFIVNWYDHFQILTKFLWPQLISPLFRNHDTVMICSISDDQSVNVDSGHLLLIRLHYWISWSLLHFCDKPTFDNPIIVRWFESIHLLLFGKGYSLLITHLQIFQCGKYSDKIFLRQYIYCFQTSHVLIIIQKNYRYILIKFRHCEQNENLTITKYLFSLYLIRTLTTLYESFYFDSWWK